MKFLPIRAGIDVTEFVRSYLQKDLCELCVKFFNLQSTIFSIQSFPLINPCLSC